MLLLKLAFRNIFRQRRRSILTGLSMTGGYLLCALSFSLVEGSYNNVIEHFIRDQTGHIQIHQSDYLQRPRIYKNIDNFSSISKILSSQQDVKSFAPRIKAAALVYANNKNTPAQVVGIDPDKESTTTRLRQKIKAGTYIDSTTNSEGYYSALIGRSIADLLKLKIGDEIILLSQGADGSMANDIFIVKGIAGTRSSRDRLTIYLPIPAAQDFFSMQNKIHEVAVLLNHTNQSLDATRELQEKIGTELNVSSWQEIEETFYRTMQADKRGNRFTLGIIVFIVFIGVLNTVLMTVFERTKEFGVLKSIGTRPGNLLTMIVMETTMLSLISCALGFLLSLILVYWFTVDGFELAQPLDVGGIAFTHVRGEISPLVFVAPLMIIFFSSILVSIPPGIRAARISPVKALGSH